MESPTSRARSLAGRHGELGARDLLHLRARSLAGRHGELGARDLLHLSCCIRREVRAIMTFDRPLAAAFPHS
jgi:predicted nucleic acid-binding protein